MLSALALASALAASAQTDALSFIRKPAVGDVAKYKMAVNLEVQGNAIEIAATITEKVTAVATDGNYTIETSESDMEFKMAGQSFPADASEESKPRTTKYSATGVPLEITGSEDDTTTEAIRMEFLNIFELPKEPRKLGDKWSSVVEPGAKLKGVKILTNYEFVRTEKVGEWDCAVIVCDTTEQSGDKPAVAKKTVWIDTKSFTLIKMDSKMTNALLPGVPDPMDVQFSMTRIP